MIPSFEIRNRLDRRVIFPSNIDQFFIVRIDRCHFNWRYLDKLLFLTYRKSIERWVRKSEFSRRTRLKRFVSIVIYREQRKKGYVDGLLKYRYKNIDSRDGTVHTKFYNSRGRRTNNKTCKCRSPSKVD